MIKLVTKIELEPHFSCYDDLMEQREPMQQEGYDFMAAAFEVYNELGPGFTEEIYQESLERELQFRKIPYVAQSEVVLYYKREPLNKKFRLDLLIFGQVVVELKAVSALAREHEAQLLNYLKATRHAVGYLLNFGFAER